MNDSLNALMVFVVGAALLVFYFLPAIIAARRHVSAGIALFVVNLFLGWTLLFWVVCLIWAAVGHTEEEDEFFRKANRAALDAAEKR